MGRVIGFGTQFDDEPFSAEDAEPSPIAMRLTGSRASDVEAVLAESPLKPYFSLSAIRLRRRQPDGVVNDWIYSSGKFTSIEDGGLYAG